MSVDRSLHPHPRVTVLVDPRSGGEALERTVAALRAVQDERLVHVVVAVEPAAGRDPAEAWRDALAAVSNPAVLVLAAGLEPTAAWVEGMLDALERAGGSAVAAPVPGGPPRPAGLSFVGHPLDDAVASRTSDPRTLFLGDAWIASRHHLEAAGDAAVDLLEPARTLDLGWRLWLTGSGIVVADDLPIDGAPGERVDREVADPIRREADALAVLYRNLDDGSLGAALPAATALSPRRLAAQGVPADRVHDGVAAFHERLDALVEDRRERQARRRRPDAELVELLRDPLRPDCTDPAFVDLHHRLVRALPGEHRFGGRYRVVVATRDSLAPRMAGPGIRAWNIARELAREHEVRLLSVTHASLTDPDFSIELADDAGIEDAVEWCDVFIFQGWVMGGRDCFQRDDRIFVVDVYDPMHLEQLEQGKDDGEHNRRRSVTSAVEILNEQLERGDFFLCASEKQRDFWLGSMASLGRINPATYDRDESLRSQIAVVPFGIPDEPATRTRDAIKGVLPGVGADDRVILWGGGVYNWFDPLTLIRAVDRLRTRVPDVKLVFLGMRHPNAEVPEMRMAREARELAGELGLTGSTVIFNEQWVAYEDRQNYLLDADVAVTTHLHHIETEFSFRTRVLDYLWAGLPTVATSGDALADLIERDGLGLTVPPNDVDALEDALFRLLDDRDLAEQCRKNIQVVQPAFTWSVGLRPLVAFCRAPRRAADLALGEALDIGPEPNPTAWVRYKQVFVSLARDGDWSAIVRRGTNLVRRLARGVRR